MKSSPCRYQLARKCSPSSVERTWSWTSKGHTNSTCTRERRIKTQLRWIFLSGSRPSTCLRFKSLIRSLWDSFSRTPKETRSQTRSSLPNKTLLLSWTLIRKRFSMSSNSMWRSQSSLNSSVSMMIKRYTSWPLSMMRCSITVNSRHKLSLT